MICWGEYVTLYFAHKRPGKFSERHLKYFREQQEKHGKRVFYYNAPKGASPVSPEWNYFGMEWHCSPPRLGEYMRDAQTPNRAARNMYLSTFACLNSKDFFDYKLDSIGGFLQNPEYKVRDLYFDLTWPRPCANPVHGCQWTDEFGYRHRDGELKQLRLLLEPALYPDETEGCDRFVLRTYDLHPAPVRLYFLSVCWLENCTTATFSMAPAITTC